MRTDPAHEPARVGIVSLFGMYNFGNRLQGHAVDSLLQRAGASPTTLVFSRKLGLSVAKKTVVAVARNARRHSAAASRQRRFIEFTAGQRIRHVFFPQEIPRLARRYDFFVAGSDQVWHPHADLYPGTKLLQFAQPWQRIALAPSFGVTELSQGELIRYRAELSQFVHLSAREFRGAALIEQMTETRPCVLADPTVGLERDHWESVAARGTRPPGRYVLTYFLGGMRDADRAAVCRVAEKLQAPVVDVADIRSPAWASGPQDFLSLIEGAAVVLTDSFHASIFATMFEVPFYVFRRAEAESTYSRLSSLLSMLKLKGRTSADLDIEKLLDQDFGAARRELAHQRAKLEAYVRRSIGGN